MSTPLPIPERGSMPSHPYRIPEFDQEPADIVQEQEDEYVKVAPVPTTVCEPVRSIALPAKSGGWRQYDLTTTDGVRILDRDPRRKRAVIQLHDNDGAGTSQGAVLGGTQAEALNGSGFILAFSVRAAGLGAASALLEITSTDEVWASAHVAECVLSVMNEQWAE